MQFVERYCHVTNISFQVTALAVRASDYWQIIYSIHHRRCYSFFPLVNILLIKLVDGTMATLANQGVAKTLIINLSGNNTFVIAYAVANL